MRYENAAKPSCGHHQMELTQQMVSSRLIVSSTVILIASASVLLTGCETTKRMTKDPFEAEATISTTDTLQPQDFVAMGTIKDSSSSSEELDTPEHTSDESNSGVSGVIRPSYMETAKPGTKIIVSGLVGQVNGRPIYVDEIFAPIEDELSILGRELNLSDYAKESKERIEVRLRTVIENQLLLAEAESTLTDQHRVGLRYFIKDLQRDQILMGGQGSRAEAERRLMNEQGLTLEEYADQARRSMLIRQQVRTEIESQIVVSWRDVEQYYRDHLAEFDPDATVRLRLILLGQENAATTVPKVEEALAVGQPFEFVAQQFTELLKSNAGLMSPMSFPEVEGTLALTAFPEVNEVVSANLVQGEIMGPITTAKHVVFVQVEQFDDGAQVNLKEAQKFIEGKLRDRQFRKESTAYFQKLLERGNYDDLEQMSQALFAVALDRWGPAQ